ncbi:MAG: endonuclease III domain-containing protein, partial [Candidatus Micrarchaeota archaeon]|nr:endonuclease III domain-containing protein [Candidatus Micrarchaeota archaeon]
QNTAWPNAEKALQNLQKEKAFTPERIAKIDQTQLARLIRPAGYFNQKTRKLKIFSEFYLQQKGQTPSRDALLALWGIGPETADSILLYAYSQNEFVVDAYTRRIGSAQKWFPPDAPYHEIKSFFQSALQPDYRVFQEYHALLVEHGKHKGGHQ